jgi:hypothetical protein
MRIFCFILCYVFTISFGVGCLSAVEPVKPAAVSAEENAAGDKWKEKNTVPDEVVLAARKGLPGFLKVLDEQTLKEWKVSKESLGSASLGAPFRLWKISPETVRKYRKGDSVRSLLSEINLWYFPVMIKGEMRLMYSVGKKNPSSPAVAGGLGDYLLANELKGAVGKWHRAEGYGIVLVTARPGEYFFTVPEKDQYNLTLIPTLPYMKQHSTFPELDLVDNVVDWLKGELESSVPKSE